jgi:hypothetical protein
VTAVFWFYVLPISNDYDFAGGGEGNWYFKFDALGQKEWSEDYPATPMIRSIRALDDGGFEMFMFSYSNYGEFSDPIDSCKYWKVRFNKNGTIGRMEKIGAPHTTGHFCFTQRRHARNALIIRGNRYQSLRTLRRCVENVQ